MDPHTGKKIQFDGNGTFPDNNKMSNNATLPPEKTSNGDMAVNNDGIPIETVQKTIKKRLRRKRNKWTLIITFTSLVLIIIFITIAYLVARKSNSSKPHWGVQCSDGTSCSMTLVETRPDVLKYKQGAPKHETISSHWQKLIRNSLINIDILSMYWTMKSSDVKGGPYKQAVIGEQILQDLRDAAARGVKIRIIQSSFQNDTTDLGEVDNIEVRTLNMKKLLKYGIVHTKFFSVDGENVYIGSANMDWRALTEIKELGVAMYGCTCSVSDVTKIFDATWMVAKTYEIPKPWPTKYHTQYNKDNPITVHRKDSPLMKLYWSTSPPQFCAPDRTSDIEAIIDLIRNAKKFVYISLMDYLAAFIYTKPQKYWDVIDRELRAAFYDRGVDVRLMPSKWNTTRPQEVIFLKSLNEFGKMPNVKNGALNVKMFVMPSSDIPYARVSHSKYMVTESKAFISTSNWSGDYFEYTAGISMITEETQSANNTINGSLHEELRLTFLRDWESEYAKDVSKIKKN